MKKTALAASLAALALTLTACSTATAEPPAEKPAAEEQAVEETPAVEPGTTRDAPLPIGSKVTDGDWTVSIDEVKLDATADLLAYSEFNEAPADGNVYVQATATVTYNGNDPQGAVPFSQIDFVTADGNTIPQAWIDSGEDFTLIDPLYEGASHTGNVIFEVPAPADGTLAVTPDTVNKMFVAIK